MDHDVRQLPQVPQFTDAPPQGPALEPAAAGEPSNLLSKGSSFNDSSFSQYDNHLFHVASASDGTSHPSDPSPDAPRAGGGSPRGEAAAPVPNELAASAAAAAAASRRTLAASRAAAAAAAAMGSGPLAATSGSIAAGGSRSFRGSDGGSRVMHTAQSTGDSSYAVTVRPTLETSVDVRSRMGYIEFQLDAFGPGAGVLGEYYMADASPGNRFNGGAVPHAYASTHSDRCSTTQAVHHHLRRTVCK